MPKKKNCLNRAKPPRWVYDFNCKKCENLRYVYDPAKKRDGIYCIPAIEIVDRRPPDWTPFNPDGSMKPSEGPIHADDDRHLRCDHYCPKEV